MGRFSDSKIFGWLDQRANRAFNALLELLDRGYWVEKVVNGIKREVRITPEGGIEVLVDNKKVLGLDEDGRAFVSSISNIDESGYYMTYGYAGSPGLECFMPNIGKFLGINPTVSGGFQVYDKNGKLRINVNVNGSIVVTDSSGNTMAWLDEPNNNCQLRAVNGVSFNAIGVDATGAYKTTSGVKTYL